MHMLKGFARVWLELTDDVAYEPLRDITAEDARAEGVETGVPVPGYKRGLDDPRLAFAALWNHINARRGPEEDRARFTWARNPEVAVIRHRVLSTTGRPQP